MQFFKNIIKNYIYYPIPLKIYRCKITERKIKAEIFREKIATTIENIMYTILIRLRMG